MAPEALLDYGYALVFLGSIVEGDATLLAAAFLAHQGKLSFGGVLLTAAIASTLVNEAIFYIARCRSRSYFERKIEKHPKYQRIQRWISVRSVPLLLFSRYIFGFRLAIPAACGITGMHPIVFSALNTIGAALWVIPLGYAGYAFGGIVARFWRGFHEYEWHIAVAVLAIGWTLLVRYDPELRMIANLFTHTRNFAVAEAARMGRLRRMWVRKQRSATRARDRGL